MLCNMRDMLNDAEKNKYAVGAFNTPNLETLRAVIDAAEELNSPVILNHAQAHQSIVDIALIGPLMIEYAKKSKVPVCVHIDHGTDKTYLLNAIKMGFTSVMYDCSNLPFNENMDAIASFVKDAHMMDITVEAELGVMPGNNKPGGCSENDVEESVDNYTNVEQARQFVAATNVDALAISFGSVHCKSKDDINLVLDIERLKAIDAVTGSCKLVMHGGSGVSDEQMKLAITNGIRKINYYTYMGIAPAGEIVKMVQSRNDMVYFHEIANLAQQIMNDRCKDAIKIFLNR